MSTASPITIDQSRPSDHAVLTEISFAAKKHWNYPAEYYDRWKEELTITEGYITRNIVYNAYSQGNVVGFYSLVENPSDFRAGDVFIQKGWWLEHMFILPAYHRIGIGRMMIAHMTGIARSRVIDKLLIFADPFAQGFYEKTGAELMYESKSSIPGRMIPVFALKIDVQPSIGASYNISKG